MPALAWSIIWATNHYVAQTFLIPSASMATTLAVGDRVLVTQLTRGDIKRGEIVVFTDPDGWLTKAGTPEPAEELNVFASTMVKLGLVAAPRDDYLIKRVIGVAGDHIVADGTGPVIVNGHTLTEPYLDAGIVGSTLAFDVTVPEGFVWVMGDNRENSADSRYNQDDAHHGMVPLGDVFGTAVATLMPSEHMGMLTDEGKAIADLG